MKVKCISNKGYENGLDVGEIYEVVSSVHGFYEVINKWGDKRCFEVDRFEIVNESHQQEEPAFNDLIDVAVQAYKDGIIDGLTLIFNDGYNDRYVDSSASENKIKQEIDYIQSLYQETFVIECEDDIKRIKGGAKITFSNGFSTVCSQYDDNHIAILKSDKSFAWLNIDFLKGATVEQSR